jgi:TolB-like protein/DNA-binding winged helix-turn-helix (wHTH) protein/Tfp pilus assembly protein PilF
MSGAHHGYRFAGFTLDLERQALFRDGEEIPLRPKAFEVLKLLAGRSGTLVTKDEFMDTVWADTVVTDGSLTQCLAEIRRALGDDRREMIRTVPRRGVIFELPVVEEKGDGLPAPVNPVAPLPDPSSAAGPAVSRRVFLLAVLTGLGLLLWWILPERPGDSATKAPAPVMTSRDNRIAVLPFADMSASGEESWFGDGMAEEIINLLAVSSSLEVISRTSSFAFKDRPDLTVREIAETLNVAHVVEGSVRWADDRLRVTAQLIDTSDSTHLWSKTYDRQVADLFAVQTEIAVAVASALAAALKDTEIRLAGSRPVDPRAHERYLQGRFLYHRRAPGDVPRAIQRFKEATAIQPDYAAAWASLVGAYRIMIIQEGRDRAEMLPLMREAGKRAEAADPDNAEVQLRLAALAMEEGDVESARCRFQRALALEPGHPLILETQAGQALAELDIEQALVYQRKAAALDPLSPLVRGNFAQFLVLAGRYEEARVRALEVIDLSPGRADSMNLVRVNALLLQGRSDLALALLNETEPDSQAEFARSKAIALHDTGHVEKARALVADLSAEASNETLIQRIEYAAHTGDKDTAYRLLQSATARAREARQAGETPWWARRARSSPFLRSLYGDPRWDDWMDATDLWGSIECPRADPL